MKNYTKKTKVKFIAVAAGFIVAFTTVGGTAYAYNTPYSYVSLDVNPSIEYSVNMFDRVIDVTAVNEDGEAILSNIDVEDKTIDEAIKETVSEINEQGYIPVAENNATSETGGIVISTSSENEDKADELAEELKTDVEDVIAENDLVAEVETLSVGKERVLEAKELGVTPGKLNLVEKLQKSAANPNDVSIEEWLNKPVKEIMKATKANKVEQKVKPTEAVTDEENEVAESEGTKSGATNVQSPVEKSEKAVEENRENKVSEKKNTSSTVSEKKNTSDALGEKSDNKRENKASDKDVTNKAQNDKDNENKGNGKNK